MGKSRDGVEYQDMEKPSSPKVNAVSAANPVDNNSMVRNARWQARETLNFYQPHLFPRSFKCHLNNETW